MSKPGTKPNAHYVLSYMLTHSEITRKDIAEKLGISRKTLYEWEYQLTPHRIWMTDKVAEASGVPFERVPLHVRQKAEDAYVRSTSGKPKEEPRIPKPPTPRPKRMVNGLEVELNYGTPTERNKNPQTFVNVTAHHRKLRDEGVEIPSDADLPDLVSIALKGVGLYDAVYVPRHKIPRVTEECGAISLPNCWYYKSASGQVHRRMTQEAALAHIEELRQEDDLIASGLL